MGAHEIVAALLDAGADCNLQGSGGVTATMASAYVGAVHVVKELVTSGSCDLNIADANGATALDYALAVDDQSHKYQSEKTTLFRVDKVRAMQQKMTPAMKLLFEMDAGIQQ